MKQAAYHTRRILLSHTLEKLLRFSAWRRRSRNEITPTQPSQPRPKNPQSPADFRPLENACFQDPYDFYRMLRDDYPVYRLPNGIFCISRFEDIMNVSRDTDTYSSTHQGIIAGLRPDASVAAAGARLETLGRLGIVPVDVLALSDPPKHTAERKTAHKGLNSRYVKSLEGEIETLCASMMDAFIERGQVEFMGEFAWALPMRLIIRLLGFPEADYEKIKAWCVHGIATQSGIASPVELMHSRAEMIVFVRYVWQQYLRAKQQPREDLTAIFVNAASDPANPMTDQIAVSAILQLLLAGSDSSATSMGNALKMLIENPEIQAEIRTDMTKLDAFVEEAFRLESAFQGHFRWVKEDTELHGVKLPRDSRIFLMWASGNRDERMFDQPDKIDLQRKNGKKHLTFGHGIHACIGRELARSEIRIVLREFLQRTENLRLAGDAPFQASMFAHTLLRLPVLFDPMTPTKVTARAA